MPKHSTLGLLATVFLASTLSAQDAMARHIAQSIAELARPERAAAAARALEHLGAAAVPPLSELLAGATAPNEQRQAALYVLFRLGAKAAGAVSVVQDAVRSATPAVRLQACWTLAQIAPFAPTAADPEWLQELGNLTGAADDRPAEQFALSVALQRCELGPAPEVAAIGAALATAWDARRVAGALALAAALRQPNDRAQALLELAALRLAEELRPVELPWHARDLVVAPWLAEAMLDAGAVCTPDLARALAVHFDPLLRQRAALVARDLKDADLHDRTWLLPLLWDPEEVVRRAALSSVVAAAGHEQLAPLARIAAAFPEARFAGEAATAVGAALAKATNAPCGERARRLLHAAVGRPAPAAARVGAEPVEALFAELLAGAEWCDDDTAERLLVSAEDCGVTDAAAVLAVRRLLGNTRQATRAAAAAWLCRRGTAVAAAWPTFARDLGDLAATVEAHDVRLAVVDVHACALAGPGATDDDLVGALASTSPRALVLAMGEIVRRGPVLATAATAALQSTIRPWPGTTMPAGEQRELLFEPDLTTFVAAAASLALAVAGAGAWDDGELVAFVAGWRGVDRTAARRWLLDTAPAERSTALLTALDAATRQALAAGIVRVGAFR